jgi:hypothetical protein
MVSQYKAVKKDLIVAIAFGLIVSTLAWSVGAHFLQSAHAAALTGASDTLGDSRPGFTSTHNIVFYNPSSTAALGVISYTFDPTTSAFGSFASLTTANVTSTGMNIVASCGAGTSTVTMVASATGLTFTVCASNSIPVGTTTLKILSPGVTNPTSTGSYIVRIVAGTNAADTRIAVVNGVNVTAAIATTFTFTVSPLATSTTLLNNATTTGNDSSTTLPFGTITPNSHNELGQQLNVTTNASNGFAVTIHEDQDMTSNKGNSIHLFSNANATSTPSPWTAPTNIINNPLTYGHFGITSDDTSSTAVGAPFFGSSTPLYAGSFNPTSTLTVFGWTGPADGTTQNVGAAKVAMRIEISPLQAAANDYVNNLIYVATPIF